MPTIECLGSRRWRATVDGEVIGEYPRKSVAEFSVKRHLQRRRRRNSLMRNGLALAISVVMGTIAITVLSPWVAVPIITVCAYGVWRALAGLESASTDRAWVYRDQIYQ